MELRKTLNEAMNIKDFGLPDYGRSKSFEHEAEKRMKKEAGPVTKFQLQMKFELGLDEEPLQDVTQAEANESVEAELINAASYAVDATHMYFSDKLEAEYDKIRKALDKEYQTKLKALDKMNGGSYIHKLAKKMLSTYKLDIAKIKKGKEVEK